MSNDNKLTVIQKKPLNGQALEVANTVLELVKAHPDAKEVIAFVNINNEYRRISTDINNTNEFIAMLEVIKLDSLLRMRT
jgi:hypothetical protein